MPKLDQLGLRVRATSKAIFAWGSRRKLVTGFVVLVVLAITPWLWVQIASASHQHSIGDVPSAPVALVLSAGLTSEGTPTPFLAGRLDVAAELLTHGTVKVLLLSGDNSTAIYDEPSAMRAYLVGKGVPDSSIVSDYAGFDTWDSCVRAKRIFGVDKAVVVTQEIALCRSAGIDADGVSDESFGQASTYGYFREIFASGKAFWDGIVTRPDPTFLGNQEPGVQNALKK